MKKRDITFSVSQLVLFREYYHSGLPGYKFSQEKGIPKSTFMRWIRIFEDSNPSISDRMKKSKKTVCPADSDAFLALRLENERLRSELKQAQLQAHAYDTMIDVAEEMFNVPIRKKAGTKQ